MLIIQNLLVYLTVLAAFAWLVKKFFLKKKSSGASGCKGSGCSCH